MLPATRVAPPARRAEQVRTTIEAGDRQNKRQAGVRVKPQAPWSARNPAPCLLRTRQERARKMESEAPRWQTKGSGQAVRPVPALQLRRRQAKRQNSGG